MEQCEVCRRRREQRRLRQLHRYSTDEVYRHSKQKAGNESYRKNRDIGRARSYLRQHQLGHIRNPNAELMQRYEALVAQAEACCDKPHRAGSGIAPSQENDPTSPSGQEFAMVE